jgi:hypothetical protein
MKMFNSKLTSIKYLSREASQSTLIIVRFVDKASGPTFRWGGGLIQQKAVSITLSVNGSWKAFIKLSIDVIPLGFFGERVDARIKSCRLGTGASQDHFSHHVSIPHVTSLRDMTLSSDGEFGC